MTLEEKVEALEEKNAALKSVLEQASEGPFKLGKIEAGPENGLFRITGLLGGEPSVLPAHPDLNPEHLKPGINILMSQYLITSILPETLEVKEPPVEFHLIKWEEIGGIKSQIDRIREAIEFPTQYAEYYKEFNMTPSKGVLLHGPTGVGKTMVAKAIASTILEQAKDNLDHNSFVYLKGGELLNPYVGVTEMKIKSIFENARKHKAKTGVRSVIFIDEAEAILPARGSRRSSDVETTIVPTFLSEMDGFEEQPAFIILATNHPEKLDPAVIRPGRIDMIVELKRPTVEDSEEIFEVHLKKAKILGDLKTLSKEASELLFNEVNPVRISGAFIANVVQEASLLALKKFIGESNLQKERFAGILGKKGPDTSSAGITMEEIRSAIEKVK